jgi:hypothetical protein
MHIQTSNLTPHNTFVNLWLRSVVWSTIYGGVLGALVIVILINGYGFLVWADIVSSNNAYNQFSSTLNAMLLYIPFEVVAGALIGGGLGALQSVFMGLVIGRVTMTRFYPPSSDEDLQHYHGIIGRLSIVGAFFITLIVSVGYTLAQMASDDAVLKFGDVLIVTIAVFLITYAAWCASRRVCHWYTAIEHQPTGVE